MLKVSSLHAGSATMTFVSSVVAAMFRVDSSNNFTDRPLPTAGWTWVWVSSLAREPAVIVVDNWVA